MLLLRKKGRAGEGSSCETRKARREQLEAIQQRGRELPTGTQVGWSGRDMPRASGVRESSGKVNIRTSTGSRAGRLFSVRAHQRSCPTEIRYGRRAPCFPRAQRPFGAPVPDRSAKVEVGARRHSVQRDPRAAIDGRLLALALTESMRMSIHARGDGAAKGAH